MTNITKFLDNPTLLRVIEPDHSQPITGLTVLGSELFVVRKSSRVFVYGCDSFSLIREIKITGSKELRGLVSCSYFNCLYLCDPGLTTIYRYDAAAGTSKDFATVSSFALSVTKTNHNVLATLRRPRQILEYTTHGQLLRKIDLDHSMDQPYHCIQLSTGNFIVSHEGTKHHRVRIVDKNGLLVQSYGESNGKSDGQLCRPRQIAVDKYDNIVVADFTNNRVQLLSSTLSYLGDVIIPGQQLEQPYSIHVDELNHRLYIGECGLGGRVFGLGIRANVGNRIEADELSTTEIE